MNSLRRIWLVCIAAAFALGAGSVARAQLPKLPGLGGDNLEAPSFRLATSNTLRERAKALRTLIEDGLTALPDDIDEPRVARTQSILEEARETVEEAIERLERDRKDAELASDLDGVVALFRQSAQATREVESASRAEELHQRTAGETTSLSRAKALRFRAASVNARSRAQWVKVRAQASAERLRVRRDDVRAAAAQLREANSALEEATRAWRSRLSEAGGDDVGVDSAGSPAAPTDRASVEDARFYRAEALQDAALARVETLSFLYEPAARSAAPRFEVGRRVIEIEQLLSAAEVRRQTVRARGDESTEGLSRLEQRIGLLSDALDALRYINAYDALIAARVERDANGGSWLHWLVTGIMAVICLALITTGQKIVHLMLGVRGTVSKRLKLSKSTSAKIDVLLTLGWYALVLGATVLVALWGVWSVDISFERLMSALRHPLFLVEGNAVTAMSIVQLALTFTLAVGFSRVVRKFLRSRIYSALDWDTGLSNAVSTILHYLIIIAGGMIGLRFVGIGLSSLALFAGVLGIGIGFGLRNIVENFISGLILLAERPIQVGDFVHLDSGLEGQVRRIRARSTTVRTRDNVSVIVPNSHFVGNSVTNWSHGDPKVRVEIEVGIAYGSNVDLTRKSLMSVAEDHGQVLQKPSPVVYFRAFGDSSLNFSLLAWIKNPDNRFRIASDLHFAIDAAFRRAGVEIAYPQMDLHLRSVSGDVVEHLQKLMPPSAPSRESEDDEREVDGDEENEQQDDRQEDESVDSDGSGDDDNDREDGSDGRARQESTAS